jgi:integrase
MFNKYLARAGLLYSGYVFCKLNGERYKDIRRGFKNALKNAGLDTTISIHDLRHTFATWSASKGTPHQF